MSSLTMPEPNAAVLGRRAEIAAALREIVPGEGVIDRPDGMRPFESRELSQGISRPPDQSSGHANGLPAYRGSGGPFPTARDGANGFETDSGPGDPGYLGGRWKEDFDGDGEFHYFLCPLPGPGRE